MKRLKYTYDKEKDVYITKKELYSDNYGTLKGTISRALNREGYQYTITNGSSTFNGFSKTLHEAKKNLKGLLVTYGVTFEQESRKLTHNEVSGGFDV